MPSMTDDAPWVRPKADGFLGWWHMPAGRGPAGVLVACDRTFPDHAELEEQPASSIPANQRCPVCQGVHAAMERSRE